MWPYEEYSLLQNILVLLIPWLIGLLFYFLCRPLLFRKIAEKQAELENREEDKEHW